MSKNIHIVEIDGYSYGDRLLEGVIFHGHIEFDTESPEPFRLLKVTAPSYTEKYLKSIGGDGAVQHWCDIIMKAGTPDDDYLEPIWESKNLTFDEFVALVQYDRSFGEDDDGIRIIMDSFGHDSDTIEKAIKAPSNGVAYSNNPPQGTSVQIEKHNLFDAIAKKVKDNQ